MPETEYLHKVFGDIQQYNYLFNTTETCTDGVTIVQSNYMHALGTAFPFTALTSLERKRSMYNCGVAL